MDLSLKVIQLEIDKKFNTMTNIIIPELEQVLIVNLYFTRLC